MSRTLKHVQALVAEGDVRVSDHGYDELAEDGVLVRDLVESLPHAELVEDYPGFPKGPCVLVLQHDRARRPVHAVWGIPKGHNRPAVLITAYRPDPERWTDDFRSRKQ